MRQAIIIFALLFALPAAVAVTPYAGGGGGGGDGNTTRTCESVLFIAATDEPIEAASFSVLDHEHEFILLSCTDNLPTCSFSFDNSELSLTEGEHVVTTEGTLTFLTHDTQQDANESYAQARFMYSECQDIPDVPEFGVASLLVLGVIGGALVLTKKH